MANTITDNAINSLATAGFATGSVADRELAYLTSKVPGVGSYADKSKALGRKLNPISPTYP